MLAISFKIKTQGILPLYDLDKSNFTSNAFRRLTHKIQSILKVEIQCKSEEKWEKEIKNTSYAIKSQKIILKINWEKRAHSLIFKLMPFNSAKVPVIAFQSFVLVCDNWFSLKIKNAIICGIYVYFCLHVFKY